MPTGRRPLAAAPRTARVRLFCFPYAGGGASQYRTWQSHAPAGLHVCPMQLPGREDRLKEPPLESLEPLLDAVLPALLPRLDMPFALFGHSMGALVCFELARALRRLNQPAPVYLFVSGRAAPQSRPAHPPLHRLPDAALVEKLRAYGGTPEAVLRNADLRELFLPIVRADLSVVETYRYRREAPLDCPIAVYGGSRDRHTGYDDLIAWRHQTVGDFSLWMFEGGHFFVRQRAQALLAAIECCLRPAGIAADPTNDTPGPVIDALAACGPGLR